MKNRIAGMGPSAVVFLLAILILGLGSPLGADAKAGAQLKIVTKNGAEVQGELLAVKGRTLLVYSSEVGDSISLALDEVRDLTAVREKSKALSGLVIGLLGGAAAGASSGIALRGNNSWGTYGEWAVVGAKLGAVAGGFLGMLIGAGMHQEEPLIVASTYQLEPDALLKKLRVAARFPEAR